MKERLLIALPFLGLILAWSFLFFALFYWVFDAGVFISLVVAGASNIHMVAVWSLVIDFLQEDPL